MTRAASGGRRGELERKGPQTEFLQVENERAVLDGRTAEGAFLGVDLAGRRDGRGKPQCQPAAGLPVSSFSRTTISAESSACFTAATCT